MLKYLLVCIIGIFSVFISGCEVSLSEEEISEETNISEEKFIETDFALYINTAFELNLPEEKKSRILISTIVDSIQEDIEIDYQEIREVGSFDDENDRLDLLLYNNNSGLNGCTLEGISVILKSKENNKLSGIAEYDQILSLPDRLNPGDVGFLGSIRFDKQKVEKYFEKHPSDKITISISDSKTIGLRKIAQICNDKDNGYDLTIDEKKSRYPDKRTGDWVIIDMGHKMAYPHSDPHRHTEYSNGERNNTFVAPTRSCLVTVHNEYEFDGTTLLEGEKCSSHIKVPYYFDLYEVESMILSYGWSESQKLNEKYLRDLKHTLNEFKYSPEKLKVK